LWFIDEGQLQLLFVHEGPLRTTKGHEEGQGQLQKGNGNFKFLCPRRTAKGREEGQGQLQERQLQKVNGNY